MNSNYFDTLETRSFDERENDNLIKLKKLIDVAKKNEVHKKRLMGSIETLSDIKNIEILRKSDLIQKHVFYI